MGRAPSGCGCCCWIWGPLDTSCCPTWPGPDATDQEKVRAQNALHEATEILRSLTVGTWGLCEQTVRPCYQGSSCGTGRGGRILDPYLSRGRMFNRGCGCPGSCMCNPLCAITLAGPVYQIMDVFVDGVRLEQGKDYKLTAAGELYRIGGGCWPSCQDLAAGCEEPGSFCVHYLTGRCPADSVGAIRAFSALACKIYAEWCGQSGQCGTIDHRVTSVDRDGVSWDLNNDEGARYTGITLVDSWIARQNPNGLTRTPQVVFSDVRPGWKIMSGDCVRPAGS